MRDPAVDSVLGLLAAAGLSRVLSGASRRKARKLADCASLPVVLGESVRAAIMFGVSTEIGAVGEGVPVHRVHSVELPGGRRLALVIEVG